MMSHKGEVEFFFIQTMPMEEKRKEMGWAVDESEIPYVIEYYKDKDRCRELILESDVVLLGWSEGIIKGIEEQRLSSGKLTFRISERIYREGQWKFISPRGLVNKYREHIKYRGMPVYLLCTGAYVASDFNLIGAYPGKRLKWGYFPEGNAADEEKLHKSAEPNGKDRPLRMCWAGRLIDLKHPEFALKAAKALKERGYSFALDLVGDGALMPEMQKYVKEQDLSDCVNILGGKDPKGTLEYMKRADIFLFTSNYLEGWGAVVNEAMSSECAVVASAEAGAVPFLLEDGINGLVYSNGSYEKFENKVISLFENKDKIRILAKRARETIDNTWNAKNAASELIRFCKEYMCKGDAQPATGGPMSTAKVIKAPGVVRTLQEENKLE